MQNDRFRTGLKERSRRKVRSASGQEVKGKSTTKRRWALIGVLWRSSAESRLLIREVRVIQAMCFWQKPARYAKKTIKQNSILRGKTHFLDIPTL
jgi:hypothetical protein